MKRIFVDVYCTSNNSCKSNIHFVTLYIEKLTRNGQFNKSLQVGKPGMAIRLILDSNLGICKMDWDSTNSKLPKTVFSETGLPSCKQDPHSFPK